MRTKKECMRFSKSKIVNLDEGDEEMDEDDGNTTDKGANSDSEVGGKGKRSSGTMNTGPRSAAARSHPVVETSARANTEGLHDFLLPTDQDQEEGVVPEGSEEEELRFADVMAAITVSEHSIPDSREDTDKNDYGEPKDSAVIDEDPDAGICYDLNEGNLREQWRKLLRKYALEPDKMCIDQDDDLLSGLYLPFNDKTDWEIAKWKVEHNISDTAFDELLRISEVSLPLILVWMPQY